MKLKIFSVDYNKMHNEYKLYTKNFKKTVDIRKNM